MATLDQYVAGLRQAQERAERVDATRGAAHAASDVDLLVDDLDPARYFAAAAACDRILASAHVDLVRVEDLRAEIAPRVLEEALDLLPEAAGRQVP